MNKLQLKREYNKYYTSIWPVLLERALVFSLRGFTRTYQPERVEQIQHYKIFNTPTRIHTLSSTLTNRFNPKYYDVERIKGKIYKLY